MKRDHDLIKAELEALKAGGMIRPADVIQRAKSKKSALHNCFTWDDSEAGHQFRLLQARNLLRVYVLVEANNSIPVRAFVSLTTDRKNGGGYRAVADVMSDDAMRLQMLRDALTQMRNVQKKYKNLQQLSKVWEAVDEAERASQVSLAA